MCTKFNQDLKEEETVQILNKGDIFGDSEVLEQTARSLTVTTALDVMFWSVEGQVSDVITSFTTEERDTCNCNSVTLVCNTVTLGWKGVTLVCDSVLGRTSRTP